jgi:hypothetical protein
MSHIYPHYTNKDFPRPVTSADVRFVWRFAPVKSKLRNCFTDMLMTYFNNRSRVEGSLKE